MGLTGVPLAPAAREPQSIAPSEGAGDESSLAASQSQSQAPEGEYFVHDIVDARPTDAHYLVRWLGHGESTWEPIASLTHCREALNDYLRKARSLTPIGRLVEFEGRMRAFRRQLEEAFMAAEVRPRVEVLNEIDFEAPSHQDFTFALSSVYRKGVPRPSPEFLAGCPDGCSCHDPASTTSCSCVLLGKDGEADGALVEHNYTGDGRLSNHGFEGRRPLFECNENCACKRSCRNRVVQKQQCPPLQIVKLTDARGWGVLAAEDLPAGTFIDRYHGEVITSNEAEKRARTGFGSYLFDLDAASSACLSPGRAMSSKYTVDANTRGSLSRFLNHSCEPNCLVQSVFIESHDPALHAIAVFAARDISAGEQLTFDYFGGGSGNTEGLALAKRRECLCGSQSCRKFIYL